MKRVLLGLLILLVVAGVAVTLFADELAEEAIARGGSWALGVDTQLDSADLSLLAGRLEVAALSVDNPGEFEGNFVAVDRFDLEMDPASLLSDTVQVHEIVARDVELTLLQQGDRSNYGPILESLRRFESDERTSREPDGRRLNVGTLRLLEVHATVDLSPFGVETGRTEISVPEVVVEDLGDGLSVAQVFDLGIKTLLQAVLESDVGSQLPAAVVQGLGQSLEQLAEAPLDRVSEAVVTVAEQATATAREAVQSVEDAGKGLGDAIEGVQKKVEDATDGS